MKPILRLCSLLGHHVRLLKCIVRLWAVAMAAGCVGGCAEQGDDIIVFAISAEYPPFEYAKDGDFRGFDIDLANLIAKKLQKTARFQDMNFPSLFMALNNHRAQAAISTIAITPERQKNFDFSDRYYTGGFSVLYMRHVAALKTPQDLRHKKIACQLGTTMEVWLKKNVPDAHLLLMDTNPQAVEALKAGHVEGVLVDSSQASSFVQSNSQLAHSFIAKSEDGYGIALRKGSPLTAHMNKALKELREEGAIEALEKKWLM